MTQSQSLQPGYILHLGTYRIERVLGQGGFGITYLATDTNLDKKVAIKEFFPKSFCNRDNSTSHLTIATQDAVELVPKLKAKFIKEARNIAKFNHPNIIKIHAAFEENDTAYYVMDYIEGASLSEIVKSNGALGEARALNYIRQVGSALKYIHERKVNHLDVKPANVMVRREDDTPILIDFGLSKQYDEVGVQTSTTPVGISHGYAPIEQYNAGGVKTFSPQTDVYSLAATLYYLLSGVTPPSAPDLSRERLTIPTSIPKHLVPAITKGMSLTLWERYESVQMFLDALGGKSSIVPKSKEVNVHYPKVVSYTKYKVLSGLWITAFLIGAYNYETYSIPIFQSVVLLGLVLIFVICKLVSKNKHIKDTYLKPSFYIWIAILTIHVILGQNGSCLWNRINEETMDQLGISYDDIFHLNYFLSLFMIPVALIGLIITFKNYASINNKGIKIPIILGAFVLFFSFVSNLFYLTTLIMPDFIFVGTYIALPILHFIALIILLKNISTATYNYKVPVSLFAVAYFSMFFEWLIIPAIIIFFIAVIYLIKDIRREKSLTEMSAEIEVTEINQIK